MKAPVFWHKESTLSRLLAPLGYGYYFLSELWRSFIEVRTAPLPVICVGNAIAGGAGKTPVALKVAETLSAAGAKVHFASRGYGGNYPGHQPLLVDTTKHRAWLVGDEPLLLAQTAPCWVGRDRLKSAKAAAQADADLLLLDDGFQNPSLKKNLSLLVIDGAYGNGNGCILPAGPLRQPFATALKAAQAIIMIGEDHQTLGDRIPQNLPLWPAHLVPSYPAKLKTSTPLIAFAGIGRPEKFFTMLESDGYQLADRFSFADHHPYTEADIRQFQESLKHHPDAKLVTTAKDHVRLPSEFARQVTVIPVELQFEDETGFSQWIQAELNA